MMKVALLSLTLAASAFAQSAHREPQMIHIDGLNADRLFAQATAPRASVSTESAANQFIIAVVGSVPGAGSTYFRSEVTFVNNRTSPQSLAVFYFPAVAGGCNNARVQAMTLDANTFYVWPDFVGDVFGTTGLGSLVVFAVTSSANLDANGNLDGFSRIWTPVPGFQGTASQSFPSVQLHGSPDPQYIYGLRHEPNYRTNISIFNYLPTSSQQARTFQVSIAGLNGGGSMSLSVPPCSLVLAPLPQQNFGALAIGVYPPDSNAGWFAFASSVDNQSGDNWSIAARPAH